MKKALALFIVCAFVLGVTAPLYADLPKPIDKLTKGTLEVAKSPLVVIDHTKKEIDGADYKVIGLIKGLVKSPFHVVMKAGKGALDVATFPID